jgi:hypothetical protein
MKPVHATARPVVFATRTRAGRLFSIPAAIRPSRAIAAVFLVRDDRRPPGDSQRILRRRPRSGLRSRPDDAPSTSTHEPSRAFPARGIPEYPRWRLAGCTRLKRNAEKPVTEEYDPPPPGAHDGTPRVISRRQNGSITTSTITPVSSQEPSTRNPAQMYTRPTRGNGNACP